MGRAPTVGCHLAAVALIQAVRRSSHRQQMSEAAIPGGDEEVRGLALAAAMKASGASQPTDGALDVPPMPTRTGRGLNSLAGDMGVMVLERSLAVGSCSHIPCQRGASSACVVSGLVG